MQYLKFTSTYNAGIQGVSMHNFSKNLRFSDFNVEYLIDETLREGVERCPFPINTKNKLDLLKKMTSTGLREFIVGCGPEIPDVWEGLFSMKMKGEIPSDTEVTFIFC
jgi:2-isopropylmalate synthase